MYLDDQVKYLNEQGLIEKGMKIENHEREMARWLLENHETITKHLRETYNGAIEAMINELRQLIKKHEELCK